MTVLSGDKLKIFVSSTIKECKEEREQARAAINSLNHIPFLFEDLGSRPHPPRLMYRRGIEESHIFIAIYREEYGWVADDMDISGIEDEYNIATERGMEKLIYITDSTSNRDEKLAELINKIKKTGEVTYASYSNIEELYVRIREDVTAVISSKFLASGYPEKMLYVSPSEVIKSLIPNNLHIMRRANVEKEFYNRLSTQYFLVVYGPLGCGKTILLALIADEKQWLYINARGKSLKEVIGYCANSLRAKINQPPLIFNDADHARYVFIEVWKEIDECTLVIDNFNEMDLIKRYIDDAGGASSKKRISIAKRTPHENVMNSAFMIPPFNRDEIHSYVSSIRKDALNKDELDEIVERSDGNPLYLRYYASGRSGQFVDTLTDYEKREWENLPNNTKEALSYIVLSDIPLSLGNLKELLGYQNQSIEDIFAIISEGTHLLRSSGPYYDVFHEHFRSTIFEVINCNKQKFAYYSGRLGNYLYDQGDIISAFIVLDKVNHPRAVKIINEAAFTALVRGEIRRGIYIVTRKLALSHKYANKEHIIAALLALASLKQQEGDRAGIADTLSKAEIEAKQLGDPGWLLEIRRHKISLELFTKVEGVKLKELIVLRDEFKKLDDFFGVGKLSLDLSVVYIKSAEYSKAVQEAREALRIFNKIGDEYGAILAKSNLLSALSGIPEAKEEAALLLKELSKEIDPQKTPRQHALLCNIYNRQHRKQGNIELAKKFAIEAISIGEKLGDKEIIMNNRINLGNVYRDENVLDRSLQEYSAVEKMAHNSGFKQIEANANMLIATIHNEYNEAEHSKLAIQHATYAIGLLKESTDIYTLARSYEEKGDAMQDMGNHHEAASEYFGGAKHLIGKKEHLDYFFNLVKTWLFILTDKGDIKSINNCLDPLFLYDKPDISIDRDMTSFDQLFQKLPFVINSLPIEKVIPITGMIFRVMLQNVPDVISRRIIMKILMDWTHVDIVSDKLLLSIGSLLSSAPVKELSMIDIVEIAERVSKLSQGLYFKPHSDGAHHWTIKLDFSTKVICTIDQLDDRGDIGLICMIMAVLLKGLEEDIQSRILMVEEMPRTEISIVVGNVSEMTANLDLEKIGLQLPMKDDCLVTRSTDPLQEEKPPIFVICKDDITKSWQSGHRRGSSLQVLIGLLLLEMVYQLFNGDIEMETLQPKLVSVVRKTIS